MPPLAVAGGVQTGGVQAVGAQLQSEARANGPPAARIGSSGDRVAAALLVNYTPQVVTITAGI
jgi:hypothetical protein